MSRAASSERGNESASQRISRIATSVEIHSRAWWVPRNSALGRPGASVAAPIFTARIGRPSSDAPIESTWISVSAAAQAASVARMPVTGLSNER